MYSLSFDLDGFFLLLY